MPPLVLMLVGIEKEIEGFKTAVESCSKTAMMSQCGTCHGLLMSNHFTAKGKEEYSDAIKKLMKEKYPDVPIVCWGIVKKGGTQGKDYDIGLEWNPSDGPSPIAKLLNQLKNGSVTAGPRKGRKSVDGETKDSGEPRESLDKEPTIRRKSIDGNQAAAASPARRKSIDEGSTAAVTTSLRRKSVEGNQIGTASPARRKSIDEGSTAAASSSLRRKSVEGSPLGTPKDRTDMSRNVGPAYPTMGMMGMGTMGGISIGSMTPKTSASGMVPMTDMSGMGIRTSSMTNMTNMVPMTNMSGMIPGTNMINMGMSGMNPMTNMSGMAPMNPLTNMSNMSMGGMHSMTNMVPMTNMGGMVPMTNMSGMVPMTNMSGMVTGGMTSMTNMVPMTNMSGMTPMANINGMGVGDTNSFTNMSGIIPTTSMGVTNMGTTDLLGGYQGNPKTAGVNPSVTTPEGGSNAGLIKALTEEVMLLKAMLEDRKKLEHSQ